MYCFALLDSAQLWSNTTNNKKGRAVWVVKVGGSLLGSPELERWLGLFAKFSDGNIIIVPMAQ